MQKKPLEGIMGFVCDYWWTLIILLLVISLVFFFSNTIPAVEKPEKTQNMEMEWRTFNDLELGISINYPSTWFCFRSTTFENEGLQGRYVLFSSTLGNTSIQSRTEDEEARLVISITPNLYELNIDEWLSGSPLLLEQDVTRLILNGYDAIRIITPPENEDDHSTHIFLFLDTGNRFFSLVGTVTPSERADLWSGIIVTMQDSFRVIS